jgi:hypothetical protein
MDGFVETNHEPRKEWAAPELKKIDIEAITAANTGPTSDGNSGGS